MVRLASIVLTLLLLGWLNDSVVAQTQDEPTKLITKKDLTACLEAGDFASMVRAVDSNDSATLKSLLAAKKCVRWPAGTHLFLNETYKASGPNAIPGVTGDVVHVYTADDYRTYLASFPFSVGDAEIGKLYKFMPDQLAQKRQSEASKLAQGEPAERPPKPPPMSAVTGSLSSSTDPSEIAQLILHSQRANSSARIEGDRFIMTYSLKPWSLTMGTAISASNIRMADIVPLVFERFPKVNRVEVSATGEFDDIRGNSYEKEAVRFVFTRSNSATIRWNRISYSNMPKLADEYWIHPAMTK
jgi:hypothetical protein